MKFFARFFGEEALHPIHYMDLDWCREEFSKGGYTSICGTGTLTMGGNALREPVGRIHWAGTETARRWTAYMDGALESAERVSEEIDCRFKGKPLPKKPTNVQWQKIQVNPYFFEQNAIIFTLVLIISLIIYKIFQ